MSFKTEQLKALLMFLPNDHRKTQISFQSVRLITSLFILTASKQSVFFNIKIPKRFGCLTTHNSRCFHMNTVHHWYNTKKRAPPTGNQTSSTGSLSLSPLLELTQLSSGSIKPTPQSSMERLSEGGLDSVEESHGFRDAVEGQNTCSVIQVHSYSGGPRAWEGSDDVVMSELITTITDTH